MKIMKIDKLLTILAVLALAATVSQAANGTWNVASGDWSVDANWVSSTPPSTDGNAYINNSGTAQLSTTQTVKDLNVGFTGTGTLEVLTGGSLTATGNSTISQNSGSTGTLTVDGGSMIFAGKFNSSYGDAVATVNLSSGLLELRTFSQVYTDNTTWNITGGTLTTSQLNTPSKVSLSGTATLSPGGDGGTGQSYIYHFGAHSLDFGDNTHLRIDIAGTTQGTTAWTPTAEEYDYVRTDAAANLDGDLDVYIIDGFTPESTDSFTILTASTINGTTFDNTIGGKIVTSNGGRFTVTYNANSVVLNNYQPPPTSHWTNVSESISQWNYWQDADHHNVYIGGGGDQNWLIFDDGLINNPSRQQYQYLDLFAALETADRIPERAILKWTGNRNSGSTDIKFSWFAMPEGSIDLGRTEIIEFNGAGRDGNEIPDYYAGNTAYGSVSAGSLSSVSWDITDLVKGWYDGSITSKGEMLLLWDSLPTYVTWGSSGPTLEFFVSSGTLFIIK